MRRSFQDDEFAVDYLRGDVLAELIGFSAAGPSYPQKLLFQFARCGWFSCFLSAFIAHWDALEEEQVADVVRDYSEVTPMDYGALWSLVGTRVRRIQCERAAGRTSLVVETDGGTLTLREIDGADPHSDSELLWLPTGAG